MSSICFQMAVFCYCLLFCCCDPLAVDNRQTRSVTCNVGYSGGGTATCGTSGTFNSLTCTASSCTATQVSNSDFAAAGSINGVTGQVSGPIPSGSLLFLDSLWFRNFILSSAL